METLGHPLRTSPRKRSSRYGGHWCVPVRWPISSEPWSALLVRAGPGHRVLRAAPKFGVARGYKTTRHRRRRARNCSLVPSWTSLLVLCRPRNNHPGALVPVGEPFNERSRAACRGVTQGRASGRPGVGSGPADPAERLELSCGSPWQPPPQEVEPPRWPLVRSWSNGWARLPWQPSSPGTNSGLLQPLRSTLSGRSQRLMETGTSYGCMHGCIYLWEQRPANWFQ